MAVRVARTQAPAAELVGWIDRAEEIRLNYRHEDGALVVVPVEFDVPPWFVDDEGEHTVASQIAFLEPILERGAVALAATIDESPVGVAVVEPHFEVDMTWFAWLHVTSEARRRGVASALWEAAVDLAIQGGDRSMYVSATPSESAVGFYLSRGCELADPPHPDLLALEPEDIHLIKPLM